MNGIVRACDETAGRVRVDFGPRLDAVDEPVPLTSRELEVLGLLADGRSNADIGDRLCISTRTARAHVSAILGKLDVSSRTEAASIALRRGLM